MRHVPNMLSGLRLAAAPATAGLLTTGHFEAALGMFAFAGMSDAADGFLAKRLGVTSRLGRYLDPAADKALMLTVLFALTLMDAIPLWLTMVMLAREVLLLLGLVVAVAAQAPLAMRPLVIGKASTALQVLYIGAHLAALAFGFSLARVEPGDAYVLAAMTSLSLFAYCGVWITAMRRTPRKDRAE